MQPKNRQNLPEGFVYLNQINPDIRVDLKYYGEGNFLGRRVDGYNAGNVVILTELAADALQRAQSIFHKDGFDIVVYDAYRPQRAVDDFGAWANNAADQKAKATFYPRIDKSTLFDVGYLAKKSSHSRGSTVDLSLIERDKNLHPAIASKRILNDGMEIVYLDDGTIDMGSSFDLFDLASHDGSDLISKECAARRTYMKKVMESCNFKPFHGEWWHFTMSGEPFPDTYFNFPVQS